MQDKNEIKIMNEEINKKKNELIKECEEKIKNVKNCMITRAITGRYPTPKNAMQASRDIGYVQGVVAVLKLYGLIFESVTLSTKLDKALKS